MPIFDPKIEVVCDNDKCGQSETVEPDFGYNSYDGHGAYLMRDDEIIEKLDGWTVEFGEVTCDECNEDEEE